MTPFVVPLTTTLAPMTLPISSFTVPFTVRVWAISEAAATRKAASRNALLLKL